MHSPAARHAFAHAAAAGSVELTTQVGERVPGVGALTALTALVARCNYGING